MKNLFKKTSSSLTASTHKEQSTTTPPVTPSPTKPESSAIHVRITRSQKDHHRSSSDTNSTTTNDEESTLLAAVLGLGCGGSPLWDTPGKPSLMSIPEENDHAEWGTPPNYGEDSEEEEEESLDHDDFELVLNELNDDWNLDGDLPVFCQPCEASIEGKILDLSSVGGSEDKKKRRKFKLPKMKNRSKLKDKDKEGQAKKSLKSKNSKAKVPSAEALPKRKTKSLRNKEIGKAFHARFHKKRQAQEGERGMHTNTNAQTNIRGQGEGQTQTRGRWKCVQDTNTNRVYYYHTLTRKVTWSRPQDFVEWRVASDSNNKKYFYNVVTKETSWDMPEGYEQWREVKDEKSGRVYYYNVLTRKTKWDKPADFKDKSGQGLEGNEEEKEKDTRNRSISNGVQAKEGDKNEQELDRIMKHAEVQSGTSVFRTLMQSASAKDKNQNNSVSEVIVIEPESEKEMVPIESRERQYSTPPKSRIDDDEPPKIVKTDNQVRLNRLLSTYCPDEKENNAQLMHNCRGQETAVIKDIEGLVEETPFDELRLAIFSYVKSTLKELGEEPFDEKRRRKKHSFRQPVAQLSPARRMNRVNTYASTAQSTAAYSLTSRGLSHVTGKSNVTEQTNRINNTSNRMLSGKGAQKLESMNKEWFNPILDQSCDELTDVTDDEDTKQVVLDMKLMQKEPIARPVATKAETWKTNNDHGARPVVGSAEVTKKMEAKVEETGNSKMSVTNSSPNESRDEDTLETAYAADNDDETDNGGWEPEDDVSALSDSFGPSISKRYLKEKKIVTEKEESLRKKKVSI